MVLGKGVVNCFRRVLHMEIMDHGLLIVGQSIIACISSCCLSNSANVAPCECPSSSFIDTFFLSFPRLVKL